MEQIALIEKLSGDLRFFPTVVALFVLALLLLFFPSLSEHLRDSLVPALVVYAIGSSLIAYIQAMLNFRFQLKAKSHAVEFTGMPIPVFSTVVLLHIVWFSIFVLKSGLFSTP